MAMNNESDTNNPRAVANTENGGLTPELMDFIAEVTRDEVRNNAPQPAYGFVPESIRSETESDTNPQKPLWRRGLEEAAIAVGAAASARVVDPSIIIGGAYAVLQFGRPLHGYRRKPLQTLLSQQQAAPRNALVTETKVFEANERSGRLLGTLAKGVAVTGYSVYLSVGAPSLGSAENASTTPVTTEAPNTTDSPASTANDILPYNSDCEILHTPIPLAVDNELAVEQKDDYELSVKRYQELLRGLGLYQFTVDGVAGEQTQNATRELKKIIVEIKGTEGLNIESGVLTTQECIILLEAGIWNELIEIYERDN